MSRRGLNKFDTSLLSNDGGKYSPSIRRLRQHYLHDTKCFTGKIFSSLTQPSSSSITTKMNEQTTSDSPLSSPHHQSSIDLIATSLKCDDCQKNDGLFQCCHCNQRLCIRCCNKHYKKVTVEIEHLHELSDHLLTKIFHIKTDLDKQKNETIEQCHKWRIDTINTINKAHTLIIQTIHDEYEILGKEYELFVEKEMSHINIDKNKLIRIKKGSLGSLISSPSSTLTIDSTKSINTIKKRIETFTKYIDKIGKFSFQVKLPKFDINNTLRVESRFGDITRSTNATWQDDDYINDIPSTKSEEISKKKSSPDCQSINSSSSECETNNSSNSPSIDKDIELQPDHYDSTYGTASSSTNSLLRNQYQDYSPISINQFNSFDNNRCHTYAFHQTSSSSPPLINKTNNDNEDTYQSVQQVPLKCEQDGSLEGKAIQIEQSQENDGIIERQRTCMEEYEVRRRTTALPIQSSNTDRLSDDCSWFYYRTNSTPSSIE